MVDQEHVNELKKRLDEQGISIHVKPDYQVWWHHLVAWFVKALLWCIGRDFDNWWTTLGNHIYAPTGPPVTLLNKRTYMVVCHELAHNYDDERYGLHYKLSYILSGKMRGNVWELRGYGMQMVAAKRIGYLMTMEDVQKYVKKITGPTYLWAGDPDFVSDKLLALHKKLQAREIDLTKYDPHHISLLN